MFKVKVKPEVDGVNYDAADENGFIRASKIPKANREFYLLWDYEDDYGEYESGSVINLCDVTAAVNT